MTYVRKTIEVTHHVRAWRKHRGLSIDSLGMLAGLTGSLISQLERGKAGYTQHSLEKVAEALGCEPWHLLCAPPDRLQSMLKWEDERRVLT